MVSFSTETSQTQEQSVPIVRKKSSRSLAQSLKIPGRQLSLSLRGGNFLIKVIDFIFPQGAVVFLGSSESKKKKSDSGPQLSKEFYKKMEEWNQIKEKQEKQEKVNKDSKGEATLV